MVQHRTPDSLAANGGQVYFGRQEERGIRLRSIRRRFWEILTICGFRLELGEGEGWTSPPLSFAAKLIDPSANYTKTFRQKSAQKNVAAQLRRQRHQTD